jgi:hypothetical protein
MQERACVFFKEKREDFHVMLRGRQKVGLSVFSGIAKCIPGVSDSSFGMVSLAKGNLKSH